MVKTKKKPQPHQSQVKIMIAGVVLNALIHTAFALECPHQQPIKPH